MPVNVPLVKQCVVNLKKLAIPGTCTSVRMEPTKRGLSISITPIEPVEIEKPKLSELKSGKPMLREPEPKPVEQVPCETEPKPVILVECETEPRKPDSEPMETDTPLDILW